MPENIKDIKAIQSEWKKAEEKCKDLRNLEDEAFQKSLPELKGSFDDAKEVGDVGIWNDFLPDGLDDTEIHLVDSAGQAMDIRVGPVFGQEGIHKEPGIWIGIQRRYLSSGRNVEFLISPEIWKILSEEVNARIDDYSKERYSIKKEK
ncbi:MAG: hypothetical protein ACTSW7_00830 [Candidatus Thorarchaeota archaeon]|nr:hypothetical protein [Thermoplasmatales archaeon]